MAALTTLGAAVAGAQQPIDVLAPETYTVEVPFAAGGAQADGHERASAFVEYRFRACGTGVFVAWRLLPERTEASPAYWYRGKRHDGGSLRPPVSVDLAADIISNGARIGSMRRLAQASGAMDACGRMTANSQRVGELGNWVQLPAGPATVSDFLQTLSLRASPTNARLRNPDAERAIAQRLAAEQRPAERPASSQPPAATQPASSAGSAVRAGTGTTTSTDAATGASTGARPTASTAEQRADSARRARAAATLRSIEESNRRQAENEAKAEAIAEGVVQVAGMVGQIRANRQAAKEREEARAAAAEEAKAQRAAAVAAYYEEYKRAMQAQSSLNGYALMLPFAERGYLNTQSVVANMYLRGQGGVSQNFAEALRWYLRATENPDAHTRTWGMQSVANMYANGLGVPVDSAAALSWLRKAVENSPAQIRVEVAMAADAFAVAMGRKAAITASGMFLEFMRTPPPVRGRSSVRVEYSMKALQMGSADAQHEEGSDALRLVENDPQFWRPKAVEYLTLAAKQGHMGAVAKLRALGVAVSFPWDTTVVEPSLRAYREAYESARYAEALAAARKAAENGSARAAFLVGSMYREGRGTLRNEGEAFLWFYRSASAGDPEGKFALARAFTRGEGGVLHMGQAWKLLDSIAVSPKSFRAKAGRLRFFEVGEGEPAPTGDQGFTNSFEASSARSIGFVLDLAMPPLKSEVITIIGCTTFSHRKRGGYESMLWQEVQVFRLEPGATTLRLTSRPLGWDERYDAEREAEENGVPVGRWGVAKYTVECFSLGKEEVVKGSFTVR